VQLGGRPQQPELRRIWGRLASVQRHRLDEPPERASEWRADAREWLALLPQLGPALLPQLVPALLLPVRLR
jgi:hypothetical protein